MVRIEEALDQMFKYPRKASKMHLDMVNACSRTESSDHINVPVKSDYYKSEGVIPMEGVFRRDGLRELVLICPEPELNYEGEFLPGRFSNYKDSAKMHWGALANVLNILAGGIYQRLTVKLCTGALVNVSIQKDIALDFLMHVAGIRESEEEYKQKLKLTRKGVYINKDQTKLF